MLRWLKTRKEDSKADAIRALKRNEEELHRRLQLLIREAEVMRVRAR